MVVGMATNCAIPRKNNPSASNLNKEAGIPKIPATGKGKSGEINATSVGINPEIKPTSSKICTTADAVRLFRMKTTAINADNCIARE